MKHLALAVALALLAGSAQAAVVAWSADLAPENEVPPVAGSSGSGSATGTIDTLSGLLTWIVDWSDLTGPAVGAHFHGPATAAQNAGVVVNIGAISGLAPSTAGDTVIADTGINDLLAGLWYINIHTELNPGGEIRGQVVPVPLPANLPLLAGAAAALVLVRRRGA